MPKVTRSVYTFSVFRKLPGVYLVPDSFFVNTAQLLSAFWPMFFPPVSLQVKRNCGTRESVMGCEQNFIVLFQIYVHVLLLSNEISKGLRIFLLNGVTYLNYLTSYWIISQVLLQISISYIRYFLPFGHTVVLLL